MRVSVFPFERTNKRQSITRNGHHSELYFNTANLGRRRFLLLREGEIDLNVDSLREILIRENLMLSNNPQGTDKGDYKSYIDNFYEGAFKSRQNVKTDLLEIGFRHGASLALWSWYSDLWEILGIDNYSDVTLNDLGPNIEWISRSNVKTLNANAYSSEVAGNISKKFDIIIDDGPHSLATQKSALQFYLPKLKPNGVLVIEDIQSIGRLCFFRFCFLIPLQFSIRVLDFRSEGKGDDDFLFIVEHKGGNQIVNRCASFLRACWGLGYEFFFQLSLFTKSFKSEIKSNSRI
jgi:hypothetical protein